MRCRDQYAATTLSTPDAEGEQRQRRHQRRHPVRQCLAIAQRLATTSTIDRAVRILAMLDAQTR
jgi:hypothetical protein